MSQPPIIFSPRWWRLFWLIVREADLGGRLLCRLRLHRYRSWSEPLGAGWHRDHMACRRPFCRVSWSYTSHRSDPVNR